MCLHRCIHVCESVRLYDDRVVYVCVICHVCVAHVGVCVCVCMFVNVCACVVVVLCLHASLAMCVL